MPTSHTPAGPPTPPPNPDAPLTRRDFEMLIDHMIRIEKRGIRTETRVSRLLEHHGVDLHGRKQQSPR